MKEIIRRWKITINFHKFQSQYTGITVFQQQRNGSNLGIISKYRKKISTSLIRHLLTSFGAGGGGGGGSLITCPKKQTKQQKTKVKILVPQRGDSEDVQK